MPYRYDRGDHRFKHCWNQDRADFVMRGGHLVGKCPKSITVEIAEAVLNQAVAEPNPFEIPGVNANEWPVRLFGVYRGVIYEAAVTQPGVSYHAYPWRRRSGGPPLPREVVEQLRNQAEAAGYLEQFEDWLDQYG